MTIVNYDTPPFYGFIMAHPQNLGDSYDLPGWLLSKSPLYLSDNLLLLGKSKHAILFAVDRN